jgi:hypothetical protein
MDMVNGLYLSHHPFTDRRTRHLGCGSRADHRDEHASRTGRIPGVRVVPDTHFPTDWRAAKHFDQRSALGWNPSGWVGNWVDIVAARKCHFTFRALHPDVLESSYRDVDLLRANCVDARNPRWPSGTSLVPRQGRFLGRTGLPGLGINHPKGTASVVPTARDGAVCRRDGGQGNSPSPQHQQRGQCDCNSLHLASPSPS